MKIFIYILILTMFSCELPDNNVEYQEGLVVFGRIELSNKELRILSSVFSKL